MKQRLFTLMTILMMAFAPMAYAAEDESPGVMPGDAFYGLDKAMDALSLAFTFGNEAKASKELEIAEERLVELKVLAAEGKVKEAEEAKEEHTKLLEKVELRIENFDEKNSKEELEKELEFEAKLNAHKEKALNIEVKGDLSVEAQEALERLIVALGDDLEELEIKIKNKQEETKIRVQEEHGEDELKSIEGPYWQEKAENEQLRAEEEIKKTEEKIAEFEAKYLRLEELPKSQRTGNNDYDDSDEDENEDLNDDSKSGKNLEMNNQITGQVIGEDQITNELDNSKEGEERFDDSDEEDKEEYEKEDDDDSDYEDDEYESEDDDSEYESENEYDDNILDQYGLSVPEYSKDNVESSKQYIEDAKAALSTSNEKEAEENYEAAYAYARFAKKLAQEGGSGKYLAMTAEQKIAYKAMKDADDSFECVVDSDCDSDEFCDDGECEDLEDNSFECVVDSDCDSDEFCDDGECEDLEDSDDSEDDSDESDDDEEDEEESEDDEEDEDEDEDDE